MPFQFECVRQLPVSGVKSRQMPRMIPVNAFNNSELWRCLKRLAGMPGAMREAEGAGKRSEGVSL